MACAGGFGLYVLTAIIALFITVGVGMTCAGCFGLYVLAALFTSVVAVRVDVACARGCFNGFAAIVTPIVTVRVEVACARRFGFDFRLANIANIVAVRVNMLDAGLRCAG
ncbi:MAG: hypothetical protein J6V09_05570 [Clostridia bacterium]|nr:hypothetical protein [Clostridia bacterium]